MSKDKIEDDAKKIVREETEQTKRSSDAQEQKPEKPEKPGGFGDLFENMWGDFEDPQDSKKGKCDEFDSLGQRQPDPKSRR